MRGHSHYATIKRQKEVKDAARGKVFSKHARAIATAVREGASPDPDSNYRLRIAVELAKADNMPRVNIERAIASGTGADVLEEVTYEGFGPGGFSVMVEAATDNRNRTGAEVKNLFEKEGGRFAGPGSVKFNFDPKGFILIGKSSEPEAQILKLIDSGVEDVEESEDGIEVYVIPDELFEKRKILEEQGFTILKTELIQKPKIYQSLTDKSEIDRAVRFLENIENHDDVHKVFTNLDISDESSKI